MFLSKLVIFSREKYASVSERAALLSVFSFYFYFFLLPPDLEKVVANTEVIQELITSKRIRDKNDCEKFSSNIITLL